MSRPGPVLYITFCLFLLSTSFSCNKSKQNEGGAFDWELVSTVNKPQKRHECAFILVNGKSYLIGGRGVHPVEEYDYASNTWKQLQETPQEMHHFQAVAVGNSIWVAGAMTGGFPHETPLPDIWIFNPAANQWSKGPEIPAARRRGSGGTFVYNGKVYLICGITDGHYEGHVSWFDMYDPVTQQWTVLPDAPRARDHFQAAVVQNKLYLAGGRRTSEKTGDLFNLTVNEVDVFDFQTGKWSTLPADKNIPTPRAGCTAIGTDSHLLVMGGESGSQNNAHRETEAFNIAEGKWETFGRLNTGRHGTQALLYNNAVYIAAGSGNRGSDPELDTMELLRLK